MVVIRDRGSLLKVKASHSLMALGQWFAKVCPVSVVVHSHGGESRDILHIYSDRAGKHIRHYFIKAE